MPYKMPEDVADALAAILIDEAEAELRGEAEPIDEWVKRRAGASPSEAPAKGSRRRKGSAGYIKRGDA